jgi:hypothetical protein
MKGEPCVKCGRENKRGGDTCTGCYARGYYRNGGKAFIIAANKRYEAAHPEKRREWRQRSDTKRGIRVPDLAELRQVLGRLEDALVGVPYRTTRTRVYAERTCPVCRRVFKIHDYHRICPGCRARARRREELEQADWSARADFAGS